MTIFGKVVTGFLLLFVAMGLYYGVTSYVQKDNEVIPVKVAVQQDSATTTAVSDQTSTTTTATGTALTASSTDKSGKKVPFGEFMSKGGSYKCDITQTMATMTSKGTVYMHNQLVRVEFSISLAGQTISTAMVAKDGYMYSWTSNTPGKGQKIKLVDQTQKGNATSTSKTYTWNGSQVTDYTCNPWVADDSIFELPKTVTFTVQ